MAEKQLTKEEIKQRKLEAKQEAEMNNLIKERRQKLSTLQEEGKDPFDVYKVERTHTTQQIKESYEELEDKDVTIAGRLMSKRVHGKAGFSDVHDRYGKMQLYIKIDNVGEEKLKEYKTFDIGDFVSITGTVFKTKTEEVTIQIKDFQLLTKSLKPLPEKFMD
jgi:lysyl-tRNA synthetase class 2